MCHIINRKKIETSGFFCWKYFKAINQFDLSFCRKPFSEKTEWLNRDSVRPSICQFGNLVNTIDRPTNKASCRGGFARRMIKWRRDKLLNITHIHYHSDHPHMHICTHTSRQSKCTHVAICRYTCTRIYQLTHISTYSCACTLHIHCVAYTPTCSKVAS